MTEREDGVAGGVEDDTLIVDAKDGAFDSKHDTSIDIGDGELTFPESHQLLGDHQIHRVRSQKLRAHHHQWALKRRECLCRRRSWLHHVRRRWPCHHTVSGIRIEREMERGVGLGRGVSL